MLASANCEQSIFSGELWLAAWLAATCSCMHPHGLLKINTKWHSEWQLLSALEQVNNLGWCLESMRSTAARHPATLVPICFGRVDDQVPSNLSVDVHSAAQLTLFVGHLHNMLCLRCFANLWGFVWIHLASQNTGVYSILINSQRNGSDFSNILLALDRLLIRLCQGDFRRVFKLCLC